MSSFPDNGLTRRQLSLTRPLSLPRKRMFSPAFDCPDLLGQTNAMIDTKEVSATSVALKNSHGPNLVSKQNARCSGILQVSSWVCCRMHFSC